MIDMLVRCIDAGAAHGHLVYHIYIDTGFWIQALRHRCGGIGGTGVEKFPHFEHNCNIRLVPGAQVAPAAIGALSWAECCLPQRSLMTAPNNIQQQM